MKVQMLSVVSLILLLSSSVYGVDTEKRIEKYMSKIKKLEKTTYKALNACKKEKACIETQLLEYEEQRNKLIKSKLKVHPKAYLKKGKKVLKKEKTCLMKKSQNAKKCFMKFEEGKKELINEIVQR